jgi:pSer/pThr/pTyr-binding forkhead associated (FHA) protein
MPHFALRFISGKYQGGEFPLRMEREIVIGRSSDLDMVLVEDMVSRKHAKISTVGNQIVISDMGSTNGTFVNGEKVKKARLKEGDRILIGTSIIKLVSVEGAVGGTEAEARAKLESNAQRRQQTSAAGRPMSGSIEEIPLPDLLQLLSTSRKSGVLTVRSDRGTGKIYLRKGQIYYASIDDNFAIRPQKAIYRLLTWVTGAFELEAPDERQVMEEISESTEALLMEGVRHLDEIRRIEPELPVQGSRLAVPTPLAGRLRDLPPEQLDIFQLVLDQGSLAGVLDNYGGSDLEAYSHLLELLRREFVVVT